MRNPYFASNIFWIFNPGSYSPHTFQLLSIETPKNVSACFKMVHVLFPVPLCYIFQVSIFMFILFCWLLTLEGSVGITSEASCLTTSFSHFGAGGTAAMQLREPDVKGGPAQTVRRPLFSSPKGVGWLVGWLGFSSCRCFFAESLYRTRYD